MNRAAAMVAISAAAILPCTVSCTRTVRDASVRPHAAPVAKKASTGVADTFRRQVLNAVDAGEGDARIRQLRQRLTANPEDLQSRLELARHYRMAGFPEVAIEHYRLAAMRAPSNAELATILAKALEEQGLRGEAIAHLEAFTSVNPEAAEALSWLGILRDRAGHAKEAEESHRAALKLRDTSDAMHNNLGYNLLLQERHSEAAAEFRRALEIAPDSATAKFNLGLALAADSPKEALGQWRTSLGPAAAHSNLAAVLIEKGDYPGARRELELALGYNKDHPAALENLQILTALEGGSVRMPPGMSPSALRKFLHTLGVVLLGPESSDGKAKAAPAGATGN